MEDHATGQNGSEIRGLQVTLAAYVVVFVAKLAAYFASGVVALYAEALHTLSDTFMRAFAELEALVRQLDPEFSSLEAFRAFSGQLLKHAFMPALGAARIAQLYRFASAARGVAGDAPVALARLMGRLERGEPLFDIRHQSGGSLERHLLHASNRLAFALIIASIVIGSSILIGTHAGPHLEGLPLLGIIGFVVAGALGVAWAVIALKSGRL